MKLIEVAGWLQVQFFKTRCLYFDLPYDLVKLRENS